MTAGLSRRFQGIVLPLIGDSPVAPTGVGPCTMALITLPLSDLLALGHAPSMAATGAVSTNNQQCNHATNH